MARRRRSTAGMDSFQELARKVEILEREMAVQHRALERLKQMAAAPKTGAPRILPLVRKTA